MLSMRLDTFSVHPPGLSPYSFANDRHTDNMDASKSCDDFYHKIFITQK